MVTRVHNKFIDRTGKAIYMDAVRENVNTTSVPKMKARLTTFFYIVCGDCGGGGNIY